MDRADGGQHPLHEPADILHGEKINNPANDVNSESTASFRSRDRSLSPTEIRIMLILLRKVATLPTIMLGLKFILLSMAWKSQLQEQG